MMSSFMSPAAAMVLGIGKKNIATGPPQYQALNHSAASQTGDHLS